MHVWTDRYEFTHGHKPRGYGHWAFSPSPDGSNLIWVEGRYGDAKKAAIAIAKAEKRFELYVQT